MAISQLQSKSQPQLVFVEGSFEELALEMAQYLHIADEIQSLVEKQKSEEVLSKLVQSSTALNSVPEREFTAASNLMIYLVLHSQDPKKHLPTLCNTFSKPVPSAPVNGVGLSLNALTTIFNLLPPENPIRFRVLFEIIKFLKQHGMYESFRQYLASIDEWSESWGLEESLQRRLYEDIASLASDSGHDEESYQYILKALRTFDADDSDEVEEAQKLSIKAIRTALLSNTRYLFQDLRAIPTVQALNDSHPAYAQLLDIFAEQDLEDYNDFNEEHKGFLEKEDLDHEKLHRKMRLLTFASLAAATPSREIPYSSIVKALQVPEEEVEMWTIDAIRAGLVEGKLSQQQKVFLVHKVTYRVFGQKQWQELSTRVDQWKTTLSNVLENLLRGREELKLQQEREAQEMERKITQGNSNGPQGQRRGHHHQQKQQRERTDNDD